MSIFLYRSYAALMMCALLSFSSCKKFTEVSNPQNLILDSDVFASDATANSAVAGIYSQLMRINLNLANSGLSIYPALSADEIYNTSPNADLDPLRTNNISPDMLTVLNRLWNIGYQSIYQCNALLEGFGKSNGLSPTMKQQLQGEVLFVRAFLYFYLTNLFGDVPLVLSTDYRINAVMPRTPAVKVYEQITLDLQEAFNDLPVQPVATGRARPGKWTAQALLARTHLYRGHWQEAVDVSSTLIENADFVLGSALESIFLAGSKETIWQMLPVGNITSTAQGLQFIPSTASVRPAYNITANLWQSFDATDKRATTWVRTVTVGGQTYRHPYKYRQRSGAAITENNIVFRLAEQYLIRAEAFAMLQQPEASMQDLNKIHVRAGLSPLASLAGENLLRAIEKERFLELFTEWGHRWFDLKRTGRSEAVLAPLKGASWQSTDTLYPLSQVELQRNVYLKQNAGY